MADYNAMQKRRNMIVGGFVIVAFAAFLWMIAIFGELPVFVSQFRSFNVLVKFPAAPGIQENTPVLYCGYQVGRVTDVMPPERVKNEKTGLFLHQVNVTLAIDKKYVDIPSNVDIKLMKRGLGSSYIELQVDPAEPVDGFLANGMVLQGSTGMSSEFFPPEIQKKLEPLVDSISALTNNANAIIGDKDNKANIKQTLANITVMTEQATATLKSIKGFTDSGTDKIKETAEQLNNTLVEFRRILTKINEGQGTAAMLINDGRLYENLLDSSQELQMALEQLKILAAEAREKGIKIKW